MRSFSYCAAAVALALFASSGKAQDQPAPADSVSLPGSPHVVRERALVVVSGASAITLALLPFDQRIAHAFQRPRLQDNETLRHVVNDIARIGDPAPFVIGGGALALGLISGNPVLHSIGLHLVEGVGAATIVNGFAKGVAGRSLPGIERRGSFKLGRGFREHNGPYVAFPSGHTAAAFAMASVLVGESHRWMPAAVPYVATLGYTAATGVALARLYQNVHWASDLPLAAVIGTYAGFAVERRASARANRGVMDKLSHLRLMPTAHGALITVGS